ncbi:single-stranded DNA-binding protein [Brumimicrobium aurantiacum]|uniref:Single-stranded DNA-binding protein n=1 Tax=Brumimicrobium aurantiacum TaxID=1737063 RepID=A0A3E1F1Q6_9FLAO|nr:single-stranded DNA-binding protein [Brumimicrobium aurantiacum]RFC55761.1 single-stranded DNA-binding protein [Brumimicrobium aurantiacum]
MATVFETRLIGNLGKDATVRKIDRGVVAINFPVAHNKNWRDKKTGESRTKTTWVNCTIWKKEGSNMRILDFLKSGALVEVVGTPYAKAFQQDDGSIKTEIRLNIARTNILRSSKSASNISDDNYNENEESESNTDMYGGLDGFTLNEDDF